MMTRMSHGLRAALVALAALGWWTSASAQLTPAGTSIESLATVSYSVGGQAQEVIESSPTGNTAPGAGAGTETEFLVDNRVDLTVTASVGATVTAPGALGAVLTFTVTNTGNARQGYQLSLSEEIGTLLFGNTDNADIGLANLVIRVDEDPSNGDATGNGAYDGTESATVIDALNPDATITVFVVSPSVPLTLLNGNFVNVRLQAQTAEPDDGAATLTVESAGVNDPTTIEIVFADTDGEDGLESDADQFAIQSAALTVTKAQEVLDDGFGSPSPRAIPGATVEYSITIENDSLTTAADDVSISDAVPANTTLVAAQYSGEDIGITGGLAASCTADANDGDGDGCGVAAGSLTVGSAVIGDIGIGATVTVQFQVLIN
jgi:uncharacterized repeat protein (TIGR01451 family)